MVAVAQDPNRTYAARGGALEVIRAQEKEVLCEGPARTGKTRALLEKAYMVAEKYPGSRQLFVRKTRTSMSETVMQTFEDDVLPPVQRRQFGQARRNYRADYLFSNGSVIVLAGMDTPERIMSAEYDRAYFFETTELTVGDYEFAVSRLTGGNTNYRQAISDCNPAQPWHWLNQRADGVKMRRILSRLEDNPRWHDGKDWTVDGLDVIDTLDRLTGPRLQRLRHGRWVSAEGVVYDNFDAAIHVIHKMPDGWETYRKIRSIDFGFVEPFVCQWWAIDNDGRMFLYREIYGTGKTMKQRAEQINSLSAGEKYEATVADHDASDRATLAENGVHTTPARKDITTGIQAVTARLAKAGDGRPRIYILHGCGVGIDSSLASKSRPTSTLNEFDCYIWNQNRQGLVQKEEPLDKDNHGLDAARYAVAHVDSPPTQYVYFSDTVPPEASPEESFDWDSGSTASQEWRNV